MDAIKKTIVIYGGGIIFRTILPAVKEKYPNDKIIVVDGNSQLWGTKVNGIEVFNPEIIINLQAYVVVIATVQGYISVKTKLINIFKVKEAFIDDNFVKKIYEETFVVRSTFLKFLATIINEKDIEGNCAEGGVFEGDFAKEINEVFPNKKLYLFDTFDGFDERDMSNEEGYIAGRKGEFKISGVSPNTVMNKMTSPKNVIIKSGFFPDTTKGIDDKFVFVNLDFDLYAPTLAGLNYFWPRLVKGGVILVHDYFSTLLFDKFAFSKVKDAVKEFSDKNNLNYLPIGDKLSVAFIK
jgi:hypothetical protein